MTHETLRSRKSRFAILLLSGVVGLFWVATAEAESSDCFPTCAAPAPLYVVAGSGADAYKAAKAERMRNRERQRRQREAENRARSKVRKLERQLERGEREKRRSHYGSRYSQGSNDGQAGAHCMYGPDGKLIYSPHPDQCASRKGGPMPGPAAPTPAAQQGCVKGDCRGGEGTYVWADGTRYVGSFNKKGLQHGQGSIAFKNGASYVGAWKNGKRSGMGTAVFPDGRVKAGRWTDNKYLGDSATTADGSKRIAWPDLSRPLIGTEEGEHDVAVIVGVEDYAHVAKVPGAEQNAVDWYRYMVKTRGIPSDRVTMLLDEDATREEMRIAAEDAARLVGKKGHLWFVFIGHGAPSPSGQDGLLIGFDAQQKARSLTSRSLERSDLLGILEASRAKHIHVLLDACFSGKSTSGEQLVAGLQPLVVTSVAPTSDERTTLMTAAASDQYAGPLPGATRPAFSYLMLGGLRGWADGNRDGRVETGELHQYVAKTMRSLIRGRRQTPTLVGEERVRLVRSAKERGPDVAELLLRSSSRASRR